MTRKTEAITPAACRAEVYVARAEIAEDWSTKTDDVELRQSWLRIAEEYRFLARALQTLAMKQTQGGSSLRQSVQTNVG